MSKLKLVYSPRLIMSKGWCLARTAAKRFGGSVRSYLAEALRLVWNEQKVARDAILAMRQRVRASIATLPADIAECERFMTRLYAEQAIARQAQRPALEAASAVILTFRDRDARRAAKAASVAERSAA
jgi:hypothetical protein